MFNHKRKTFEETVSDFAASKEQEDSNHHHQILEMVESGHKSVSEMRLSCSINPKSRDVLESILAANKVSQVGSKHLVSGQRMGMRMIIRTKPDVKFPKEFTWDKTFTKVTMHDVDNDKEMAVIGTLPFIQKHILYSIDAELRHNDKYGAQWTIKNARPVLPYDKPLEMIKFVINFAVRDMVSPDGKEHLRKQIKKQMLAEVKHEMNRKGWDEWFAKQHWFDAKFRDLITGRGSDCRSMFPLIDLAYGAEIQSSPIWSQLPTTSLLEWENSLKIQEDAVKMCFRETMPPGLKLEVIPDVFDEMEDKPMVREDQEPPVPNYHLLLPNVKGTREELKLLLYFMGHYNIVTDLQNSAVSKLKCVPELTIEGYTRLSLRNNQEWKPETTDMHKRAISFYLNFLKKCKDDCYVHTHEPRNEFLHCNQVLIFKDGGRIFPKLWYLCKSSFAKFLLSTPTKPLIPPGFFECFKQDDSTIIGKSQLTCKELWGQLHHLQQKIIEMIMQQESLPIHILTGSPGVGKTKVLEVIDAIMTYARPKSVNNGMVITSFTGKAVVQAQKVVSGAQCDTIHSLKLQKQKCEIRLLAMDETSLCNERLIMMMWAHVTFHKIIVIGDPHQIAAFSRQKGGFLSEMINFLPHQTVELTHNYRQMNNPSSRIISNFLRVKAGNWPLIVDNRTFRIRPPVSGLEELMKRHCVVNSYENLVIICGTNQLVRQVNSRFVQKLHCEVKKLYPKAADMGDDFFANTFGVDDRIQFTSGVKRLDEDDTIDLFWNRQHYRDLNIPLTRSSKNLFRNRDEVQIAQIFAVTDFHKLLVIYQTQCAPIDAPPPVDDDSEIDAEVEDLAKRLDEDDESTPQLWDVRDCDIPLGVMEELTHFTRSGDPKRDARVVGVTTDGAWFRFSDSFQHRYAVTPMAYQGGECSEVGFYNPDFGHNQFMRDVFGRNHLYVVISRARDVFHYLGEDFLKETKVMIANNQQTCCGFSDFLNFLIK